MLLAGILAVMCASAPAKGQHGDEASRAAARELAREGHQHFKRGDWAKAEEVLRRAFALYQAPTIALLRARALVELGDLVGAAEAYEAAANASLDADATQPLKDAVTSAKDELAELSAKIPKLTITLVAGDGQPSDVTVTLNGAPVPERSLGVETAVNPGVYVIRASAGDGLEATQRVKLEERERRTVLLNLARQDAADARARGTERGGAQWVAGWTIAGVGVVGIGVGIAAGVQMMNQKAVLDDACPGGRCPASSQGALDGFRTARTVSLIGYGAGIAALGGGIALLLTTPGERSPGPTRKGGAARTATGVAPWIGLGSAGVTGVF
jgi:hypothetical protein